MALIQCYECGKEISDKAPSCPHCGAPKLVAANKEVRTKKSLVFSKYLKPIGIGLGIVLIPLAAVASVPLIQANGNIDAVVWRFKNKKFIKKRCYGKNFKQDSLLSKKCQSILFKKGKESVKVAKKSHSYCMNLKKVKDVSSYDVCTKNEDKLLTILKADERRYRKISAWVKKPLDQITWKGKTYTASRKCPMKETMRWQEIGTFRKKIEELGCMTDKEHEAYWRTASGRGGSGSSGGNLKKLGESLKDFGEALNPPTVYCDSFDYGSGISTKCTKY
tara:strand:+ start:19 stop:849 length:831 start_codon:yes stop_codon:yes gene_type:complete